MIVIIPDSEKEKRMLERENRQANLFYPEDSIKLKWDLFIGVILITSCILIPYRLAFAPHPEKFIWAFIGYLIDFLFLVDILVILNSAYYDDNFKIVEDRNQIAKKYLTSWFIVDLISIIPFELIFMIGNLTDYLKVTRVARIYKIIKMTRLLRLIKILRERTKLFKYINEIFKIGMNFERLVFFTIIFYIMVHTFTCLWIVLAQISEDLQIPSWYDSYNTYNEANTYLVSFYWVITTITTVGFGEITGENLMEKASSMTTMFFGACCFSFATGSLASLINNYDKENAKLN